MSKIEGLTSGMILQPYPTKYQAKDGTTFQVARLYDVAGRNLGILRTNPDNSQVVYGDSLSAVSSLAELHARKLCDAYDARLEVTC